MDYLQQCKKLIGAANSKILYLQIMTAAELSKQGVAFYDTAVASIAAFKKAPDAKHFNVIMGILRNNVEE